MGFHIYMLTIDFLLVVNVCLCFNFFFCNYLITKFDFKSKLVERRILLIVVVEILAADMLAFLSCWLLISLACGSCC